MTKARDIASAAPAPSTVSATELGYLDGVSSAIQTQIDGKSSTAHNHDSAYLNQSVIDAKGDLLVGTADNAYGRLAVSDNGSTLVADSSASTGLRYQPAKTTNHIINGGFDFWQRATSSTFTPVGGSPQYNSVDRFWFAASGTTGSMTASRQNADTVSLQYGLRFGRASGATATAVAYVGTNIESQQMKLLAGKAVVLSFYAKSGANFSYTPTVRLYSGTGTDQSPSTLFAGSWSGAADVVNTTFSPTSTMTRYTFTGTVPTTSNELAFWINWTPSGTAGANEWLQIEGVQLEVGSVATEFQRSGGTLAGELAACQRYYYRQAPSAVFGNFGFGNAETTGTLGVQFHFPVTMRVAPTVLDTSAMGTFWWVNGGTAGNTPTTLTMNANQTTTNLAYLQVNKTTSFTIGAMYNFAANNTSTAFIGVSAEL